MLLPAESGWGWLLFWVTWRYLNFTRSLDSATQTKYLKYHKINEFPGGAEIFWRITRFCLEQHSSQPTSWERDFSCPCDTLWQFVYHFSGCARKSVPSSEYLGLLAQFKKSESGVKMRFLIGNLILFYNMYIRFPFCDNLYYEI